MPIEEEGTTFHNSPSSEIRVVPCRLADEKYDRHDGANSRFSQFANTKRKVLLTKYRYISAIQIQGVPGGMDKTSGERSLC